MNAQAETEFPAEFSVVKDEQGTLHGYMREIPAEFFMDGRKRIALFNERKFFLGMARSAETGCATILEHYRRWHEWVKVPFVRKDEPADVTGVAP